jgi:ribulose-phosphate 3-epimerase
MLREIKDAGAVPSVAIRPTTPPEAIMPYLPLIGMVLLLSVQPGFGGQDMLPGTLERVRGMRKIIDRVNPSIRLQLDGGVTEKNAAAILEAGVDILIAGNAVFDAPDIEARCQEFLQILNQPKG